MKRAEHGHLSERRLLDVHVGAARVAADDRRHLETCDECRARHRRLLGPLEAMRDEARAEADAVFTDTRLATQRVRILDRLAGLRHGARVIPFPAHAGPVSFHQRSHIRYGWIAVAAAAGLLIGVGLGRVSFTPSVPSPAVARRAPVTAPASPGRSATAAPTLASHPSMEADDEALLLALEELVTRRQVGIEELRVVDALTPRAQEAVFRPR